MMRIWLTIGVVALVTLLERASFILFLSRWEMPDWFVRALRYVPVAVFPALIAPMFFHTNGQLDLALAKPKIIGGLAGLLVAWRTQNVLATLLAGMAALWLMLWLGSV